MSGFALHAQRSEFTFHHLHDWKKTKKPSVSNSLFAGVVKIFFLVYHQIFFKPGNYTLTIRFKVFDCIVKICDSKNDASLLSYDEEQEEVSESEDKDD